MDNQKTENGRTNMRVIAGSARRLRLKTPEGMGTRPTTDRIKETLFNILQPFVEGCVFVDLFCGSGGIGIEALSRGARRAFFVEYDRKAAAMLRENLEFTKLGGKATILQQDIFPALSRIQETADIVFMDPPYDVGLEKQVLERLRHEPYVTDETIVIVEAALGTDFSWTQETGFTVTREKRYKTNKHVFLRRSGDENGNLSGEL